ncbi:hypothetical protein DL93DRAFT_2214513 [Clavulina sp. PMI_390]|nr:hypothetical protein DL93DRAFT_2214513 [Clavulina sp. PMI_390]
MGFSMLTLALYSLLSFSTSTSALRVPVSEDDSLSSRASDPCAQIAGQAFVDPALALGCLRSFPYNETLKQNVLTVVSRSLDFFTFEDEQLASPPPFQESSVNLRAQIARINATKYSTDYDFNRDLFNVVNSLNDGHTAWFPYCYWAAFQNIIPAPVQILAVNGVQNVYIAPDTVAFVSQLGSSFTDYYTSIGFNWTAYAGSKVLKIGGEDAFTYVDHIASTLSGNYLDHEVRVNSVLSSYRLSGGAWSQRLGDLAGPVWPDLENLTFQLISPGQTKVETVTFPYRASYIGSGSFTDKASYWANNCAAQDDTNGVDYFGGSAAPKQSTGVSGLPTKKAAQAKAERHETDGSKASGVGLPPQYQPTAPNVRNADVLKAYVLQGNLSHVGVLMVGSFSPANYTGFQADVMAAITSFQSQGVTKVIVDVTDNGGGYVCLGEFLHLALVGSDFGYGGFQTSHRGNPLAVKVVAAQIKRGVTSAYSFYAPDNYAFLNNTPMPSTYDYMVPTVPHIVNGRSEPTGQHNLDICTPFNSPLPAKAPFAAENIVVVGNGNCASTCAQFTTVMHERHGIRMATFGGKPNTQMEYKGMAGNQVLEWFDLDSEIKTALLKDDPLAPPDLLVNGDIRINWRTAYSWYDKVTPIAFKSEPAQFRFAYTADTVNTPQNLWTFV